MCRYLEKHGGYRDPKTWGLIQWQLAQIFDLLGSDQINGAKDVLALLMVMVDQLVMQAELGWILTLQEEDPPAPLFTQVQSVPGF